MKKWQCVSVLELSTCRVALHDEIAFCYVLLCDSFCRGKGLLIQKCFTFFLNKLVSNVLCGLVLNSMN